MFLQRRQLRYFLQYVVLISTAVLKGAANKISYVLEPFESIDDDWFQRTYNGGGDLNITLSSRNESLFGTKALRVGYTVQQTETWGGFVDFGWILGSAPHNCYGATEMSLWYKILEPQSLLNRAHLRVILMDSSDCTLNCAEPPGQNLENYYSFHYILDEDAVEGNNWKELRIPLKGGDKAEFPLWRTGWTGQFGNNYFDVDRILGWRIELSMDSQGGINKTTSGSFLLDNLSCIGDGSMLDAAFFTSSNFSEAVDEGTWHERYYSSEISQKLSVPMLMEDGILSVNYTIEQAETWGGFLDYQHLAPGNAYYNLSFADEISLDYEVLDVASVEGRAHLRLILMDTSDCVSSCSAYPGQNLENYYSFHYILDEAVSSQIRVNLIGDSNNTSPFTRTGWTGQFGNNILDKEYIKGFRLELNVDSQGEIGSLVSGMILIKNVHVISSEGAFFPGNFGSNQTLSTSDGVEDLAATTTECRFELGLNLDFMDSVDSRRREFAGSQCCETCKNNPTCRFFTSTGEDCYMSPIIKPSNIWLIRSAREIIDIKSGWIDNGVERNDFCAICICQSEDQNIDCRGRNLTMPPKSFNIAEWTPQSLDLTDNPDLFILGSDVFFSISESLTTLKLPKNLRYLAPEAIEMLHKLERIEFEGDYEHTEQRYDESQNYVPVSLLKNENELINVITHDSDFFGDVCCSRGEHIELLWPINGLQFCNMVVDEPGVDAVMEEFIEYFESDGIDKLRPSSTFMGEAAESAEKCAEYCAIREGCQYFSYDARFKEAEHTCYLLKNQGTPSKVCCEPDDYADGDSLMTRPGWTSGRVARTRHSVDNARVYTGSNQLLSLNKTFAYITTYNISLGSSPLRGAVWVEPYLFSGTLLEISFTPNRIVLYDNMSVATITVALLEEPTKEETVVVSHTIKSCDTAFTATTSLIVETTVYIEVSIPQSRPFVLIIASTIAAVAILVFAAVFIYIDKRRREADAVWNISLEDLIFNDPPEIIGRGTFGLVLLSEYRGTQVAVKRVIPPRMKNNLRDIKQRINLFGAGAKESESFFKQKKGKLNSKASTLTNAFSSDPEMGKTTSSIKTLGSMTGNFTEERLASVTVPANKSIRRSVSFSVNGSGLSSSGYKVSRLSLLFCCTQRDEYERLKSDFIQEMRYLSKLRHPSITTVMGAVISRKEEPMLVMEYMDQGSLYDVLQNDTILLNGEQILPILRDVAQGVRFLHSATPQVIHGDLKAANILVDSKFRAKVADFGLSMKKQVGATGTPFWMAPELLRGESRNNASTDVYSFGIILCEVYSRRDPYDNEDYDTVLQMVADPAFNKQPEIPDSTPSTIKSLITKCLNGNPSLRPSFMNIDLEMKDLEIGNVEPGKMLLSWQAKNERQMTNKLLFDIFPQHIATALRDGNRVEPEAKDIVTIFFSDIVGFTNISSSLTPLKVSDMLDRLYNKFDEISRYHDVFKVETIGDAYMAVTNLVKDQSDDHVKRIANFALDAMRAANETLIDQSNRKLGHVNIRVGFHSGPVVANVVGSRNPRYCLFGDTVNTASRMESNSLENRIHCSERAANILRLQNPRIKITSRGMINIKGKGEMHTYWVN